MKKGLIFVLGILSFLGINTVSAEEIRFEYDTNVNEIQSEINEIGLDNVNQKINELLQYYNNNLSQDYSFYYISLLINGFDELRISLTCFTEFNYSYSNIFVLFSSYTDYVVPVGGKIQQFFTDYDSTNKVFSEFESFGYSKYSVFKIMIDDSSFEKIGNYYNTYSYYYSNFDLYYKGSVYTEDETGNYFSRNDNLLIPSLIDSTKYSTFSVTSDFIIEPYYLYDKNLILNDNRYTTIDLNQYSYVILSLKDYTPRDTFISSMYVKGQLCPTTVYNYGMEEKKDYISGWQNQGCGTYFEDYTLYLNYISSEDISNHAVYYLTGYDLSKPNLVKIDNSIYNITYITSENEDNPIVSIEGQNYLTLPYSNLTDTAILTEKNGINNTWTCAKYDTDCFMDSSGINIDDLFSKPLETLETIWDTISSVFKLVTEFISLLPPIMQGFLYLAFAVGISLGIIKIIL